MAGETILVVEDKASMADMLRRVLDMEGYSVQTARSLGEFKAFCTDGDCDLVLTDLKLPDGEGTDVLRLSRLRFPSAPVIIMTAFGSIETAVKAVKGGAYDFITKPFDPDHLVLIIRRALHEQTIQAENAALKNELSKLRVLPEIVGVSRQWAGVMEKVHRVAALKTTVLVLGESGTGKELIARAVHAFSPRAHETFLAVNCAAVNRDLIENELFGHERGAFTGAHEAKPGKFEVCNRGTLFLDEVGDMAGPLQARLLRVLQESEFERVGGTKTIKVDVRVIAASNKDIARESAENRFREDLYYRLNVFPILIPPLRERKEDIMPLARYYLKLFAADMNRTVPEISQEAGKVLLLNPWKGNVRELKNLIERIVILCDGSVILPDHVRLAEPAFSTEIRPGDSLHHVAESAARTAERATIENALRETGGNKSRAAQLLKVSYKTLLTKIKDYAIPSGHDGA